MCVCSGGGAGLCLHLPLIGDHDITTLAKCERVRQIRTHSISSLWKWSTLEGYTVLEKSTNGPTTSVVV